MRPNADGYRVGVGRIKKPITNRTNLKDAVYEDHNIAAINGVIPIPGDAAFLKAKEPKFDITLKLNSVNTITALNAYLRWHYNRYLGTLRTTPDYDRGMRSMFEVLVSRGIDSIPFAPGQPYRISTEFESYADQRPLWQAVFNRVNRSRLVVPFLRKNKLNEHETAYSHVSVEAIAKINETLDKITREIAAKLDSLLERTEEEEEEGEGEEGEDIDWGAEIGMLDPLIAQQKLLEWRLERAKREKSMSCISNGHTTHLTVESVVRTWVFDGFVTRASPNVNGTGKRHPDDYQSIDMNILQQGRAPVYILSSDVSSSFFAEAMQVENGPVSIVFRGPARSVPDRAYRNALYYGIDERVANQIRLDVRERMNGKYTAPDVCCSRPHDKPIYVRGPSLIEFVELMGELRQAPNRENLRSLFGQMVTVEDVLHGLVRSMDCVVKQCVGARPEPTKRRTTPLGKYAGGLFCGQMHAEGSQTVLKLLPPYGGMAGGEEEARPLKFINVLEKRMQRSQFPYWRLQPDKEYNVFCKEWFNTLSFGTTRPLQDFLDWEEVQEYAQIPLKKNAFVLLDAYVVTKVLGEDRGDLHEAISKFVPVPVFEQRDLPTCEEWAMFPLIKKIVDRYKKKLETKRDSKAAGLLRALGHTELPIDKLLVHSIERNLDMFATINRGGTIQQNQNQVKTAKRASLRIYLHQLERKIEEFQQVDLGDAGDQVDLLTAEYDKYHRKYQDIPAAAEAGALVPEVADVETVRAYGALLRTWVVEDPSSEHYDPLIPVQIYRQVREMVRNSVRTAALNRGHPICTILSKPRTLARREVRHMELQGARRLEMRLANGQTEKNWMDTKLAATRIHIPNVPQMSYTRNRYVRPTTLSD